MNDLLSQLESLNTGDSFESSEKLLHAKTHCGVMSASNINKLATYQPDPQAIATLEVEIEELDYQISTSTRGTKTAEKAREAKQKQLDRMVNDELPEGAIAWCDKLAADRMFGFVEKLDVSFDNFATRYGKEHEPLAVEALKQRFPDYDFRFVNDAQEFITLDGFGLVGATPDSIVFVNGVRFATLDIKNPPTKSIHLEYGLIENVLQFKRDYPVYYWQLVKQAMCAKVNTMCFVSYCHYAPEHLKLFYYEFELIQDDAEFLLSRIVKADKYIKDRIEKLNSRFLVSKKEELTTVNKTN